MENTGCGCGCSTEEKTLNITDRPDSQPHAVRVQIDGMTCGHCVASASEELSEIPGVTDVQVELVANGTSTATVFSNTAVDEPALRAAVDEAGYTLKAVL